jgi:integrase
MIYKRRKYYYMDVTVNGVRYREALNTTDRRAAPSLEKKRVAEIQAGKGASKSSRDFARTPFLAAADEFLEDRKPHVADRTYVLERNLLFPLRKFFGERILLRINAENIAAYQRERRSSGISGRTLNMEIGVLRRIMKRAKIWCVVTEDVKMDRENTGAIAKVLTGGEKKILFETAAMKDEWLVVYCAAVLAVSTTCRGIELKHLRWRDVDLFERSVLIRRSKTKAGHRAIPLNTDAVAAMARLRQRAEAHATDAPEHFVFPACERNRVDPKRPQKTWRTAWRSVVREAAWRAGREAASLALASGKRVAHAIGAWRRAATPIRDLRFHDLRHQAITELAEAGAPDATLMAVAGHLSREMLEHYSHVRMAAKREALDKLSGGLISHPEHASKSTSNRLQ